jgi:hypothetical protein
MTTVRDTITSAYLRLGLLYPGEDLEADRAVVGLELFNDMIGALQSEGSTVASPVVGGCPVIVQSGVAEDLTLPYGLNDAFPFDARYAQGVKASLAVRIAPGAGVAVAPVLQRDADKGWSSLVASYIQAPQSQNDLGLTSMPSQRRW